LWYWYNGGAFFNTKKNHYAQKFFIEFVNDVNDYIYMLVILFQFFLIVRKKVCKAFNKLKQALEQNLKNSKRNFKWIFWHFYQTYLNIISLFIVNYKLIECEFNFKIKIWIILINNKNINIYKYVNESKIYQKTN